MLMETGTRAAFAWRADPRGVRAFAGGGAARHLEPGMLLLADRGQFGFPLWSRASETGAELLWRAPANALLHPAGEPFEDKVDREFTAKVPDHLWVADSAYVLSAIKIAYAAVVIGVLAWEIVGRRVSIAMTTSSVIDTSGNKIPALPRCFLVGEGNTALQSKQRSCGK